ncbi:MAG: sn-glycerol-3-phosphate ABC transporter ATP-binding protein UgpC [Alphaproteobacteria bacterium]|nr:sn-glycerol-3-phosphate ABC transporter ATP-binding protein UgpC [Alphaproteobacteria bacterium]
MANIVLEGVTKVYGQDILAVDNIDLEIREGEFMVLLGPSGCGKSTTLRMIAGLEEVTSGTLKISDEVVNDVDPADRDLAVVFQNYALYPHMTVERNLAFGLKLRKTPQEVIDRRIRDTTAMLGIDSLLDRRPSELSGGQQQRVALGRALVRDPEAFLLDEPLSNLDAKLRAAMRTELIKIHRMLGKTVVHVTHDQVEAMTMGERICIMREGQIIQVGPPLEVYRHPADSFVAGFLASPPMNLLKARLSGHHGVDEVDLSAVNLPIPRHRQAPLRRHAGSEVVVGIRPEDVHTQEPSDGTHYRVDITVVAVEVLGPEVILVADLGGGQEISVRQGATFHAVAGARIPLYIDLEQLHFFEVDSGLAVLHGGASGPVRPELGSYLKEGGP